MVNDFLMQDGFGILNMFRYGKCTSLLPGSILLIIIIGRERFLGNVNGNGNLLLCTASIHTVEYNHVMLRSSAITKI